MLLMPLFCMPPTDRKLQWAEAILLIVKDVQAQGDTDGALSISEDLTDLDQPAAVRCAALLTRAELLGDKGA